MNPWARKIVLSIAGSAAILIGMTSCSSCTTQGCGADIVIERPFVALMLDGTSEPTVRLCLEGQCEEIEISDPNQSISFTNDRLPPGTYRVTLEVLESGRRELLLVGEAFLRAMRPNGPACPPECVGATLSLDPAANPGNQVATVDPG